MQGEGRPDATCLQLEVALARMTDLVIHCGSHELIPPADERGIQLQAHKYDSLGKLVLSLSTRFYRARLFFWLVG